jgi:Flp pilus assembly pilin Flp
LGWGLQTFSGKEVREMKFLKELLTDKRGQGMTEYALILGLVVLGIWIAVSATGLSDAITGLFGNVATQVNSCISDNCP